MNVTITPSLLSADLCNLERDIRALEKNGIKAIHIDVMDGNFIPEIAFGIEHIKAISKITNMEIDIHLVVSNPEKYIATLVDAGADCITVHQEACVNLYKTIHFIKSFGIKAGVALNPATSVTNLKYIMELLNRVLIMTVDPEFRGQKFIPIMEDKIKELFDIKETYKYDFEIQAEGGINAENIKKVSMLGATNMVAGYAIFKNGDIDGNIEQFNKILKS